MLQTIGDLIQTLLGLQLDTGDLNSIQLALRTILIYIFTLVIVRVSNRRFLSKASAFDVIVGIMLGSIMSRAINGSAPFVPTLVAGVALLGIHWIFAAIAYHTDWFGYLVKGEPVLLIKDGDIQRPGMRQELISTRDLAEALRLHGHAPDPAKIQVSYLERDGQISVVAANPEPRVFVVSGTDGIPTIRIQLE